MVFVKAPKGPEAFQCIFATLRGTYAAVGGWTVYLVVEELQLRLCRLVHFRSNRKERVAVIVKMPKDVVNPSTDTMADDGVELGSICGVGYPILSYWYM